MKTQFEMVWRSNFVSEGYLHPPKIKDWEVWFMENPTGIYATICVPMTQASKDGALEAIDSVRAEDATGPDGARRTITYRAGDPLAAGKLVPNGSGFKPAPGVLLLCQTQPGMQSNPMFYDAHGFLESNWVRAGGQAGTWMSELKGFSDMVYRGQEGTNNVLTRHNNVSGGVYRMQLDTFTYNNLVRVAWKAGQNGFGLVKTPQ